MTHTARTAQLIADAEDTIPIWWYEVMESATAGSWVGVAGVTDTEDGSNPEYAGEGMAVSGTTEQLTAAAREVASWLEGDGLGVCGAVAGCGGAFGPVEVAGRGLGAGCVVAVDADGLVWVGTLYDEPEPVCAVEDAGSWVVRLLWSLIAPGAAV